MKWECSVELMRSFFVMIFRIYGWKEMAAEWVCIHRLYYVIIWM